MPEQFERGLPLRKDGRLHSGRSAAAILSALLTTEWAEGLPRWSVNVEAGLIRNEIETLAKQRDIAYDLAHSSMGAARSLVQAVESLLPVFEEEDVDMEVRYERTREHLVDLIQTFKDSGLLSPEMDKVLETMDDPWHTRATPDPEDQPTEAEAGQAVEGYDGDATGVCLHCHTLIRRFGADDPWHHVTTGSRGCA